MDSLSDQANLQSCAGSQPQNVAAPAKLAARTGHATGRCVAGAAKIGLFFLCFILAAYGLDQAIKLGIQRIKTSDIGAFNRFMQGKVNASILVSGSSRALVQYNPEIIRQATGRSTYNIGRNGSHIDMQLAVLKAYLDRNTKPDLVVFNLDLHTFIPTPELYDPAQYMPFLGDPHIYGAIKKLNPNVWKWKYVPLYGYVVEDMRFTWLAGLKALVGIYPAEDHFDGYNPRYLQWTGDFENFKAQNPNGFRVAVEPEGIKDVEGLIGLCKEKGIRLVFVYSPEYAEAQELTSNRSEIFEQFRTLAASGGVPLLDYSPSPICKDRGLFYNSQHLNSRGADAFSSELGRELRALLETDPKQDSAGGNAYVK